MLNIIVTGGAGYIGSHVVKYLLANKYNVIVFDNLSTGHAQAVPPENLRKVDLRNFNELKEAFEAIKYQYNKIDCIMHFAAYSQVGESYKNPLKYYENNLISTLNLLTCMLLFNTKNLVFSSTCAVYGNTDYLPINETTVTKPINPYGRSKLMIENILKNCSDAYNIKYCALRYFNAAGAALDGSIGESHNPETHLIPIIFKVANGELDNFTLYGTDYNTYDGTCIRDYIHVEDLAIAHELAMQYILNEGTSGSFNLGTGKGYSIFEILETCEKITKIQIPVIKGSRRIGDPAQLYADNKLIKKVLGWNPKHNLESIIQSAWNWEVNRKF